MKLALTIALIISMSSFVRAITCPDEGFFYNGIANCTNGNFAGSVCVYTCNEEKGFVLEPPEVTTNQCLNDSTWSLPRPCCAATCSPWVNFDCVIVIDSSGSLGYNRFELIKDFVKLFVDLIDLRPNASRVGVFCYSDQVDTRTQIHLRDYAGNVNGLKEAINRIPWIAGETFTGTALRHARKELREENLESRPGVRNIILLITDGTSKDPVRRISQKLRKDGTVVVVIAISTIEHIYLDYEQLLEIATRPEDLIYMDEWEVESLNVNLFGKVLDRFCVEECLED
ncbi:matrilin-1-like [Clavelina lepadiformis]|uniref:matrilin-1-like n=1 Tax=Clavelina lepadiformis TaxID=159417 RepID=UPI004041144F